MRGLVAEALPGSSYGFDALGETGKSTHKGWALGRDRFKAQIERLTQRRTTSRGVGRPRLGEPAA
ncbi:MAG: hypothetical protein ACYCZT_12680 [Thiobacillus sp.]